MNTTTIICLNLIANHLNFKLNCLNKTKKENQFHSYFSFGKRKRKNEKIYQKKKKLINKNIKNIQ